MMFFKFLEVKFLKKMPKININTSAVERRTDFSKKITSGKLKKFFRDIYLKEKTTLKLKQELYLLLQNHSFI